jgi:hypothetical protein
VPAPEAEANLTVASYEVPGLNDDLARQLAQALADNPNVVAARWDKPTGLFQVTYSAGCPHGLLMKLQTVAPAASLKGVGRRAGEMPEQGGCGSCPSKGSCGGEH